MARRTDYENPRPYKITTVKVTCDSQIKIHGALFTCSGHHGPRSRHRTMVCHDSCVTNGTGGFATVEWQ